MNKVLSTPFQKDESILSPSDVLVIVFASILSLINIVFHARIPGWWIMVIINVAACLAIVVLALSARRSQFITFLHDWYPPPVVFFSFKELYYMIKPIHGGRDYDGLLIAVDRWMFGMDPTQWMMRYAQPWLTEILQIAYTSFYFLFLLLGYELYRRQQRQTFDTFMFTCVYGFFLSYLGYFLLPAVGPRFTLHDFSALDSELPGVLLTPWLRWFVNAGGSVPMGVPNDVALAGTQRDVFPSGHTMMTIVLMVLASRMKVSSRHAIFVLGTLLIVATVYQRYHYVIDLIAGAAFALLCIATAPRVERLIKSRLRQPYEPKT